MPTIPKRKSILYVYSHFASFVEADFDILSNDYNIDKYQFRAKPGIINVAYFLLKQLVFLSIHIWKYDVVYIWFADYHSLLPVFFAKILNKKSFIVNGGYDAARIKKINYGVFCSGIRGFFASYSMKNCTANLPVSKYVERKVKYIAPKSDTYLIYNCMNLTARDQTNPVKENIVLTVAIVNNERTFLLKGINTFIETARILPQYRFVIIGISKSIVNQLIKESPVNLTIYDRIPHYELVTFYQKAKIYCQFSLTESFGVSIAEAMFYNCIPIVTNEGAMPEVVGDWGLIVKRDTFKIAASIEKILTSAPDNNQELMEEYIREKFSPELRKEKLLAVLNRE